MMQWIKNLFSSKPYKPTPDALVSRLDRLNGVGVTWDTNTNCKDNCRGWCCK